MALALHMAGKKLKTMQPPASDESVRLAAINTAPSKPTPRQLGWRHGFFGSTTCKTSNECLMRGVPPFHEHHLQPEA